MRQGRRQERRKESEYRKTAINPVGKCSTVSKRGVAMAQFAFATGKAFDEQRRNNAMAWRKHKKGIATDYRKHRKIFHNDFHHLYSVGMPFGATRG